MSAPARAIPAEREVAPVAMVTRSKVKSWIVDVLVRIPWFHAQRVLAALVRGAWKGFSNA
jgi:hypothetical protein